MGEKLIMVGRSDPAHEGLTPMPMVNNTMASTCAAAINAFAYLVRLNIVMAPSQKGVDLRIVIIVDTQAARQARAFQNASSQKS